VPHICPVLADVGGSQPPTGILILRGRIAVEAPGFNPAEKSAKPQRPSGPEFRTKAPIGIGLEHREPIDCESRHR
jgi:hypothetical protein